MRRARFFLFFLLIIGLASGGNLYRIAHEPDFEIEMIRRVPSKLNPQYLDQALNLVRQWPAWFYDGVSAVVVDEHGAALSKDQQIISKNAYLRLGFKPKKGLHSSYDVIVQVSEYIAREKLRLRVLSDSKNRLNQLFDRLEWEIAFEPQGNGSMILGKAVARTRHWRSRVFGRLTPSILLSQIYLPNLFILSEINNPNIVYPQQENN